MKNPDLVYLMLELQPSNIYTIQELRRKIEVVNQVTEVSLGDINFFYTVSYLDNGMVKIKCLKPSWAKHLRKLKYV
jgi:hypothetical protein